MRYFEKISFEQFKKDVSSDLDLYNEYTLPRRETKYSDLIITSSLNVYTFITFGS